MQNSTNTWQNSSTYRVNAVRSYQAKLDEYVNHLDDILAYIRSVSDQLIPPVSTSSSSHGPDNPEGASGIGDQPTEVASGQSALPTSSSSAAGIGDQPTNKLPVDDCSIASTSTLSSVSRAPLEKEAELHLNVLNANASCEQEEQGARDARERDEQRVKAAQQAARAEEGVARLRKEQLDAQLEFELWRVERQPYEDEAVD